MLYMYIKANCIQRISAPTPPSHLFYSKKIPPVVKHSNAAEHSYEVNFSSFLKHYIASFIVKKYQAR